MVFPKVRTVGADRVQISREEEHTLKNPLKYTRVGRRPVGMRSRARDECERVGDCTI